MNRAHIRVLRTVSAPRKERVNLVEALVNTRPQFPDWPSHIIVPCRSLHFPYQKNLKQTFGKPEFWDAGSISKDSCKIFPNFPSGIKRSTWSLRFRERRLRCRTVQGMAWPSATPVLCNTHWCWEGHPPPMAKMDGSPMLRIQPLITLVLWDGIYWG